MLSIFLATVAFFVSSYYVKRSLENMGIPKGVTRGLLVFSIALLISYLVALAVDYLAR
jgi:hypothetical protein